MAEESDSVIRRKARLTRTAAVAPPPEAAPGAERSWRLALARGARDQLGVPLDVTRSSLARMSLAEVLELAPDRGLIAVLEGPGHALGVILLAPPVVAGIIEALTTGTVTAQPPADRRPTRTDAAMVAGLLDGALGGMDQTLAGLKLADWALGYRYASFLEDIRPLGLLLEDAPFNVLRCEVALAQGAKSGEIFMALPLAPRGAAGKGDTRAEAEARAKAFSADLSDQVMGSACRLDGVLARLSLSLAEVMNFEVGQVLGLGSASLDRIALEGMDGRRLWEGRLGQSRGLRAVRLVEEIGAPAAAPLPAATRPVGAGMGLTMTPDDALQATG